MHVIEIIHLDFAYLRRNINSYERWPEIEKNGGVNGTALLWRALQKGVFPRFGRYGIHSHHTHISNLHAVIYGRTYVAQRLRNRCG